MMSEKALLYKLLLELLERPEQKTSSQITELYIPPITDEMIQIKNLVANKKPSEDEYDTTIGGLPGACSLGLNIQSPGFLASLKSYYEAHGFHLSENIPADYLPAMLEFLYWVFLNAPSNIANKIESDLVKRWGVVILKKIIECLNKKGKDDSFYAELLRILSNYWNRI